MTFAIQLFVDPVSDTAVRSVWDQVASTGLSHMRDSGNRPHFSLALYRELAVPVCAGLLTSFAQTHAPFALTSESVGIFPGEQFVVFLAPIVNSDLLDLHREIHTLTQGIGAFPAPYTFQDTGLLTVHLRLVFLLILSPRWSRLVSGCLFLSLSVSKRLE